MFVKDNQSQRHASSSGTEPGTRIDGWVTAPTGVRGVLPARLETMVPGPELGVVLAGIDRRRLNGHELVVLVAAERRQVMFYEAASLESAAALAHTPPGFAGSPPERVAVVDEYAADELRPALGWTRRAADRFLALALDVTERFPLVLTEMKRGRIDAPKARVIVTTLTHLENHQIHKVTDESLGDAAEKTTGELGARLRRAAISCDPASAQKRYERGLKERFVELFSNEDGTANLTAYRLPVLEANRAMRHINRIAQTTRTRGDHRNIDQLRADTFLDLLCGTNTATERSGGTAVRAGQNRRNTVDIRVDLTTLAGLDDNPGEIPGWGPVIAEIARQAADPDLVWQTTVIDEHGQVVSVGTTRRRPTLKQHRHLTAETTTCVGPGCRMPAHQSDIDHNQAWSKGGKTIPENLGPLCRHENLMKEAGWTLKRNPDGSYTWTTPHGHTHTTGPDPPRSVPLP
ncbi:MAG TPA: DUF222 domain-containing protein [Acidimicrobiia bacterium]